MRSHKKEILDYPLIILRMALNATLFSDEEMSRAFLSIMNSEDKKEKTYQRMVKGISRTSCVMVFGLAAASFTLSFESLRTLAEEEQVVAENLSWIFPLVIDGSIVVFSLSALRSSLREESAWFNRLLVIIVTLLSVALNISHVECEALAMILAGTPPVLLFLSFEALMHTISKEITRELTSPTPIKEEKPLSKEARRTLVKQYLTEGMNANEIAEVMPAVSLRTIQRDIAEAERRAKND